MNSKTIYYLTLLLLMAVSVSCSTTKRLAEGETLYTGVKKMTVESMSGGQVPGSVKSAVEEPLSVKPNNPLYSPYVRTPMPIGLWAWNYLYTERRTGFKAWLYRNLAKQPVLVSGVQPDLRVGLVKDILDNHGYFGSTAECELLLKRNPKKAKLSYYVRVAEPWTYGTVEYPDVRGNITGLINAMQPVSSVKPGEQYNIDTLSRERVRITNSLRNRGYYYFRPEYLEYLADTTRQHLKADMRMIMSDGIPATARNPYTVGNMDVSLYSPTGGQADSTVYNGIQIRYQKPLKLRPKVLARAITVQPGDLARVDAINQTLRNLTKLGVFRYVNMEVTPLDSLKPADSTMNMTVTAAFDAPLDADLEVDFSYKSSSFMGPGVIFGIRHKNFLKGGEIFSVRLNGNYEWQTGNTSEAANATAVNSYEVGLNTSLTIPRLLLPRFILKDSREDAKTTFSLGGTLLNRPKFFTMASFNLSASYDFHTSARSTHNLTLLRLGYNRMLRTTAEFDEKMAEYPSLARSFENSFIPATSYTYTYDRPYGAENRHRYIWQSTVTSAGNLLYGAYELVGVRGTKNLFGNPFFQFMKGTTEFKNYYALGNNATLASRIFIGVGHAYGNSAVMPYMEQFYVGGANSIRAFTIRSIGPGSYRADNTRNGYFDQTGNAKLEMNLEYRFGIMGSLNGAVFLDAGNIWLLKKEDERPGGELGSGNFFDQLATGTGVGLRFDISYLVIRADLGIGIHTPYKNPQKKGYYNIPRFKDGLGFHLAIGYPF